MCLRSAVSVLLTLSLAGCPARGPDSAPVGSPEPAAPAEDPGATLARLADEYFDGAFARNPVAATAAGEHRFDARWPDVSAAARAEERRWAAEMVAKLSKIERSRAGPDGRVDLDLLLDALRGLQFSAEVEDPWTTDPLAYASTIGSGLDDLVARDFAPLPQRAASLAGRLEGLPALVDAAIANLSDPARIKAPQARVALGQLVGVQALIRDEIPVRTKEAPPEVRERIAAAAPAALAAVERLHAHAERVLPAATGQWRIGRDAFARKLALTLQTDLTATDVYARALAEHELVRGRMAALARELHDPLLGAGRLARLEAAGEADLDGRVVRAVLAALAADHVEPAQLRDAAERNLARLQAFVEQTKLVPVDPREVLQVIWTPPHERGVAIAGLDAPAPLDAREPGLPSFYVVQPVPDDWSAPRRESFLREYNHFMLEILSIHEAIPGHFVQLYWARRDPSKVRKLLSNGPFVEGWAVYTEHLMVEAGYAGEEPAGKKPRSMAAGLWKVKRDPVLRAKAIALHGQKFYLRTVTNAILDHEIHAGNMTEEQAVALMVDRSFQEEGEARAKWVRAQVSSTQLSTYFVGATAWFRLRADAQARAQASGKAFDRLEFHRAALGHGAPPVHRLPELMESGAGS